MDMWAHRQQRWCSCMIATSMAHRYRRAVLRSSLPGWSIVDVWMMLGSLAQADAGAALHVALSDTSSSLRDVQSALVLQTGEPGLKPSHLLNWLYLPIGPSAHRQA
jgi:hypothetical protein